MGDSNRNTREWWLYRSCHGALSHRRSKYRKC